MTPTDPTRTDPLAVSRRRFAALGLGVGSALVAGCTAGPANGGDGASPTDGVPTARPEGTFRLLVSDQPIAIDAFDSLEVDIGTARVFGGPRGGGEDDAEEEEDTPTSSATETETATETEAAESEDGDDGEGFTTLTIGETVDLTTVVGDKATSVFEGPLPEGRYTKVELYADDVRGVVDGQAAEVTIPPGKLMITTNFEVVAGETLPFVFDIGVVRKGNGGYNLRPVISESGVAGEDVPVEEVDAEGQPTDAGEAGDGLGSGQGNAGGDGQGGGPPSEAGP